MSLAIGVGYSFPVVRVRYIHQNKFPNVEMRGRQTSSLLGGGNSPGSNEMTANQSL